MITLSKQLKLDIKHVASNLINRKTNKYFKLEILNKVRFYEVNGKLNVSIANSETTCKIETPLDCHIGMNFLIDSNTFKNSNDEIEIIGSGLLYKNGCMVEPYSFETMNTKLELDYIPSLYTKSVKVENKELRFLNRCTSTDSLRPTLEGIYIDTELNRLVATDGHLLHYVETDLRDLRDSLILCNKITNSISKIHGIKETIELNLSSNEKFVQIGFDRPYGSMTFKNNFCKDQYPQYNRVIPFNPVHSITFKHAILVDSIKKEKGHMIVLSSDTMGSKNRDGDFSDLLYTSDVIDRTEETPIGFNRILLADTLSYMFSKVGKVEMKYDTTINACTMKTENSCTLLMPMKLFAS